MPNVSPRIRLVYNDDELRKAYLLLADRVAKKYLKKALKDATLITHANAHHRVPFKTGALLKSLATRSTRTRKGALAAAMSVGIFADGAKDTSLYKGDTFYGGFQEYGWRSGKRLGKYGFKAREGRSTAKKIPAKHFLKSAFEDTGHAALQQLLTSLRDGLDQAAAEIARSQARAAKKGIAWDRSKFLR